MTGETPLGAMGCGLIAGLAMAAARGQEHDPYLVRLAVGMMVMDEIERMEERS